MFKYMLSKSFITSKIISVKNSWLTLCYIFGTDKAVQRAWFYFQPSIKSYTLANVFNVNSNGLMTSSKEGAILHVNVVEGVRIDT